MNTCFGYFRRCFDEIICFGLVTRSRNVSIGEKFLRVWWTDSTKTKASKQRRIACQTSQPSSIQSIASVDPMTDFETMN